MEKIKKLQVSAIENGSVIDHIPATRVFDVINILRLSNFENQITFGTNLESKRLGKKGIIKVTDKFFQPDEINKIALFAPEATLIVIRNFKVVEKKTVQLPTELKGYVKCVNPNCITSIEQISTHFSVIKDPEKGVQLNCHYCEKITSQKNLQFH